MFLPSNLALLLVLVCALWFAIAVATANEAENKGRNRWVWFAVGALLGPLGFFAAAVATAKYPSVVKGQDPAIVTRNSPQS